MRPFFSKPGSLLGVDIGAADVKLAEVALRAGRPRLAAWAVEPLPPGVAADNIEDAKAVGDAIRRAAAAGGCRAKRAAFAVPGAVAIVKTVALDGALGDAELEAEAALEADRHFPIAAEERALDFEPLQLSATDPGKVDVLLAACRSEHVEARRLAIEAAGLRATAADIDAFCLQRALGRGREGDEPLVLADIGDQATTLLAFEGDAALFSRSAPFDAARLRDGGPEGAADWLRTLERLLRMYAAAGPAEPVRELLLVGDAAGAAGLAALAARTLKVAVAAADPFARLPLAETVDAEELAQRAAGLAAACGLALREAEEPLRGDSP